jgi:hypothetical protein
MAESAGKPPWSPRHGLGLLQLCCWDQLGGGVGGREAGLFRVFLSMPGTRLGPCRVFWCETRIQVIGVKGVGGRIVRFHSILSFV